MVEFWAMLDFIGMDTYVPFIKNATTDPVPTQASMLARFNGYFNMVSRWLSTQPANVSGLPIVLTEVGYPRYVFFNFLSSMWFTYLFCYDSSLQGMATPAADIPHGCPGTWASNTTLQQMAFEALFTSLTTTHSSNVVGLIVFWFDNPSSSDWYPNRNQPSSTWPCGWTPRGKPAECSIAKAYGGVADNC